MDIENLISDYVGGMKLKDVERKYHIGRPKLKEILLNNGVKIRTKSDVNKNRKPCEKKYTDEKFPLVDGYHYVAICKSDGLKFNDYKNDGGSLTQHIKKITGNEKPSLYSMKKYYSETGNYWWEQWFDIKLEKDEQTKKCPYCDWKTSDIENKSGAFLVHLKHVHGKTLEEHINNYPEDIEYFKNYKSTKERERDLENEHNYVICPICGKKYKKLTTSHIENFHNMSYNDFIKKYPDIRLTSDKMHEQALEAVALGNLYVSKKRFISKYENEISKFLKENNIKFESNRQVLIGREIDILSEDKKIGIEFDGLKWHTEFFGKKPHNYHLDKTIKCNEKGYGLIHIFEDEYVNHKDIVYSKLSHLFGLDYKKERVMGRKCSVCEIYKNDAKNFLDKYHIQGFVSATVYLGAFYDNKLVCVMSFKNGNIKNPDWELVRYASDDKYRYQGVASKMFSYFVKKYNPHRVVSFADRRWTINIDKNLYTNLGFAFNGFTRPDYKYYKDESKNGMKYKRIHKMFFNKKKLCKEYGFPDTMTEKEMAIELGYDRIWDCGLIRYIWESKK